MKIKHILLKVAKYAFLLLLCLWLVAEAYNFFEYKVSVKNYDESGKAKQISPVPFPSPSRPRYQLLVISFYQLFFPPPGSCRGCLYKPVIYLYPQTSEKIKVTLDYQGNIIADYPSYDSTKKGWTITAFPDGKIIDSDGKEYSYLFWEGKPYLDTKYDLSTGFVVAGKDTKDFLQTILPQLGLTPKEYNEFIVYWYPRMKDNLYNLVHFAQDEYTNTAPLTIIPQPDSILRVFMVYKPLGQPMAIQPQKIQSFTRKGFVVIEWGGTEL